MYEGVDTVVLHNELAYEDMLPVGWRPLQRPLDLAAVAALTDRNVRTLMVCATIEEQGPVEKAEDKTMHSADLLRLEVKMNLVLELMGQLLAAQQPASYVVLEIVRPVVKLAQTGTLSAPAAPPAVLPGSYADVSLLAGLLVD